MSVIWRSCQNIAHQCSACGDQWARWARDARGLGWTQGDGAFSAADVAVQPSARWSDGWPARDVAPAGLLFTMPRAVQFMSTRRCRPGAAFVSIAVLDGARGQQPAIEFAGMLGRPICYHTSATLTALSRHPTPGRTLRRAACRQAGSRAVPCPCPLTRSPDPACQIGGVWKAAPSPPSIHTTTAKPHMAAAGRGRRARRATSDLGPTMAVRHGSPDCPPGADCCSDCCPSGPSVQLPSRSSPRRLPRGRDTQRARPSLSATHRLPVVSALGVLLVLVLQLLAPRLPHEILQYLSTNQHWRVTSPAITLRNPVLINTEPPPPICPKPQLQPPPQHHVEFAGTFNTHTERSMALADQARRVAAQFEFGPGHVRKAVDEFIREMGACAAAVHPAPPPQPLTDWPTD